MNSDTTTTTETPSTIPCNQHSKACKSCPWSRTCEPSGDMHIAGSHLFTYIAQAHGPFFLPCHMAANYKGNDTTCNGEHSHCAGAAIFRANIGVADLMPKGLLKLPAGSDPNVFGSLKEFLTHHAGATLKAQGYPKQTISLQINDLCDAIENNVRDMVAHEILVAQTKALARNDRSE